MQRDNLPSHLEQSDAVRASGLYISFAHKMC